MKLVAALVGLMAVGCASSSSRAVRGPSGGMAFSVSCRRGVDNCYEEASRVCPGGYSIADRSGGGMGIVPNGQGGFVPVQQQNHMLIECTRSSEVSDNP